MTSNAGRLVTEVGHVPPLSHPNMIIAFRKLFTKICHGDPGNGLSMVPMRVSARNQTAPGLSIQTLSRGMKMTRAIVNINPAYRIVLQRKPLDSEWRRNMTTAITATMGTTVGAMGTAKAVTTNN